MSDNTQDLSKFGWTERNEAAKLLTALSEPQQQAEDFYLSEGIAVEFNPNSGNVFLVDEDYNVAMLNDDGKLENFVTCSNCGNEGLKSAITINNDGDCEDCAAKEAQKNA